MLKHLFIAALFAATLTTDLIGQQSNTVGIANLTNKTLNEAKSYARSKSEDCIVVLYCGQDMENAKKVIAGAQAALNEDAKVKGVVLAPSNPNFKQGSESFLIYVRGICMNHSPKDATVKPEWLIREALLVVSEDMSDHLN